MDELRELPVPGSKAVVRYRLDEYGEYWEGEVSLPKMHLPFGLVRVDCTILDHVDPSLEEIIVDQAKKLVDLLRHQLTED